jgi:flavin-dependent dehydrogenase
LRDAAIVAGPWTTSGLACSVRRRVDDGLLLIGDAGGYYDPFTGEGLYRGLRSAVLAVETADAALRRGDCRADALRPFAGRYAREFAPKRLVEMIVHAVTTRQPVFAHVAVRLRRRPALADALVGVTGDFLSPYEVLSPWYLARLFL